MTGKVISLEEFKKMKANGTSIEDLLEIALDALDRGDVRFLDEMRSATKALSEAIKKNEGNAEESILDGDPEELLLSCLDTIKKEDKDG